MHNPPPSVYESWPEPNYVTPETRGHGFIVSNSILIPVVILVVAARCYTRVKITGSFGLDDVLIVAAVLPGLGLMIATMAMFSSFEWNRHVWDVSAEGMRTGLLLEFSAAFLYIWSSVFTKLSVVFFCRRLLSPSHPKWYRMGLLAFATATLIGNVVYTVVFCFSCQPLSAYWDHYPPTWEPDYAYRCIDIGSIWMSGTVLNCCWDALTWLVPLPIVYQLRLPMKQRVAVMTLFLVGVCVIAASIMKSVYIHQASFETYDVTWVGWSTWVCGTLEIALGIICASAPSLRPFFSHFLPRPVEVFGNRQSYAQLSRGRNVAGPYDNLGVEVPLSPVSPIRPVHQRLESINSLDDMKPWAHSSRGSSRATSRRGSLSRLETNVVGSRPNSLNTTPATLTPGTPASKRLTPVREIEPISGVFAEDFKFNQTAALPPPDENEAARDDGARSPTNTDLEHRSPTSPDRTAAPSWWRSRSRTGSSPMKGSLSRFDRDRKGSMSTLGSDRKGSFGAADAVDLQRNPSVKSTKEKQPYAPPPASPLKTALKLDTRMKEEATPNHQAAGTAEPTPTSAASTASKSTFRQHSRKPSSSRELERFNFDVPATSSRRGSASAENAMNEFPPPPPSYGEFVETNSWIRDDRTVGRGSIAEGQSEARGN